MKSLSQSFYSAPANAYGLPMRLVYVQPLTALNPQTSTHFMHKIRIAQLLPCRERAPAISFRGFCGWAVISAIGAFGGKQFPYTAGMPQTKQQAAMRP